MGGSVHAKLKKRENVGPARFSTKITAEFLNTPSAGGWLDPDFDKYPNLDPDFNQRERHPKIPESCCDPSKDTEVSATRQCCIVTERPRVPFTRNHSLSLSAGLRPPPVDSERALRHVVPGCRRGPHRRQRQGRRRHRLRRHLAHGECTLGSAYVIPGLMCMWLTRYIVRLLLHYFPF